MLDNFVLLRVSKVGAELIFFGEFRLGSARPINLKQATGDVGHAQITFLEYAQDLGNLLGVEIDEVLVPQTSYFDPAHSELLGRDFAGVPEILGNLVGNYGDLKRRFRQRADSDFAGFCNAAPEPLRLAAKDPTAVTMNSRRERRISILPLLEALT
jgi:hypothetical protein